MSDSDSGRKKTGISDMYLVVDTRERSVVPFIETEFQDHAYVQKQVNTGDYLICQRIAGGEPLIRACIERKTHEDFAASFKDGRYQNIEKMKALREETGCQLYFFVEGAAFPSPNRRYARIPFSNILAAITKLMVRDGIYVVQTENQAHTAKRLVDFVAMFDSVVPYSPPKAAAPVAPKAGGAVDTDTGAGAGEDTTLAVPDVLKGNIERTDAEAAVLMWARLKGISVVLGKILTSEFSVADLATQKVSVQRIQTLKTATGRTINKDAVDSLLSVRSGSLPRAAKLVSGLQGVSPAMANVILGEAGTLAGLCGWGSDALALVMLPQKNRSVQLGKTRAGRIRRMLHYVEGRAPAAEPASYRLGAADEEPAADEETVVDEELADEDAAAPLPDADIDEILEMSGF
jgi:ERCC4-type nuclease